jgi:hypothetical protein
MTYKASRAPANSSPPKSAQAKRFPILTQGEMNELLSGMELPGNQSSELSKRLVALHQQARKIQDQFGEPLAQRWLSFAIAIAVRDVVFGGNDLLTSLSQALSPGSFADYSVFTGVKTSLDLPADWLDSRFKPFRSGRITALGSASWVYRHGASLAIAMKVMEIGRAFLRSPKAGEAALAQAVSREGLVQVSLTTGSFTVAGAAVSQAVKVAKAFQAIRRGVEVGELASAGVGGWPLAVASEVSVFLIAGAIDHYMIPAAMRALTHADLDHAEKELFGYLKAPGCNVTPENVDKTMAKLHESYGKVRDLSMQRYYDELGRYLAGREEKVLKSRQITSGHFGEGSALEYLNVTKLRHELLTNDYSRREARQVGPMEWAVISAKENAETWSKQRPTIESLKEMRRMLNLSSQDLKCIVATNPKSGDQLKNAIEWVQLRRAGIYGAYPQMTKDGSKPVDGERRAPTICAGEGEEAKLAAGIPDIYHPETESYAKIGYLHDRFQAEIDRDDKAFLSRTQPLRETLIGANHQRYSWWPSNGEMSMSDLKKTPGTLTDAYDMYEQYLQGFKGAVGQARASTGNQCPDEIFSRTETLAQTYQQMIAAEKLIQITNLRATVGKQ